MGMGVMTLSYLSSPYNASSIMDKSDSYRSWGLKLNKLMLDNQSLYAKTIHFTEDEQVY